MQVDGTSCSAPVWGGVIGLANSARVAAGKKVLGFLNPALYHKSLLLPLLSSTTSLLVTTSALKMDVLLVALVSVLPRDTMQIHKRSISYSRLIAIAHIQCMYTLQVHKVIIGPLNTITQSSTQGTWETCSPFHQIHNWCRSSSSGSR